MSTSQLEEFIKTEMDDYSKKSMTYILDISYVNGRNSYPFDPVAALTTHGSSSIHFVPEDWKLVASVGDIDRLYLTLSEHLVNEHSVYTHIFNVLRGKPIDFMLQKCVYAQEEHMTRPDVIWSHGEAP